MNGKALFVSTVGFRVTDAERKHLERLARLERMTVSTLIRRGLFSQYPMPEKSAAK